MLDWMAKIDFHAQLPPSQQLTSFDQAHTVSRDNVDSSSTRPDINVVDTDSPHTGASPRRHTVEPRYGLNNSATNGNHLRGEREVQNECISFISGRLNLC